MKQEALKIELSEKELEGIVGGGRASDFWIGFKEPFTGATYNNGYKGNFRFLEVVGPACSTCTTKWVNIGVGTSQALTVTGIAAVAVGLYKAVPHAIKKGKKFLGW